MSKPSEALLARFRSHRDTLPWGVSLHPYTIGYIEGTLNTGHYTPAQKVDLCLEALAAMDLVANEPRQL